MIKRRRSLYAHESMVCEKEIIDSSQATTCMIDGPAQHNVNVPLGVGTKMPTSVPGQATRMQVGALTRSWSECSTA